MYRLKFPAFDLYFTHCSQIRVLKLVCRCRTFRVRLVKGSITRVKGFPCGSAGKEFACNLGDLGSIPGSGRFPWRRERLPTPVFWPGEFNGLYSPWDRKESGTTERPSFSCSLSPGWKTAGPGRAIHYTREHISTSKCSSQIHKCLLNKAQFVSILAGASVFVVVFLIKWKILRFCNALRFWTISHTWFHLITLFSPLYLYIVPPLFPLPVGRH